MSGRPSDGEVVSAFLASDKPLWPHLPGEPMSGDGEPMSGDETLLRDMLQLAVPLWVQRFRDNRWSLARVLEVAQEAGQVVASQGDALMFRTKARPSRTAGSPPTFIPGNHGTAGVFNALAQGLAAASFTPGGVKAFGTHFESKPEWLEGA